MFTENISQHCPMCEQAGREVFALRARIAALEAVIKEVPELFARVKCCSDDGDEYYEADMDSEPIHKSDLLKKHGVKL